MDYQHTAQVEQEIARVLETETSAIALSQRLFAPDGLFSRLARSEHERRELVRSALFRKAQARLSELQRREGEEFARVVQQAQVFSSEENPVSVAATRAA